MQVGRTRSIQSVEYQTWGVPSTQRVGKQTDYLRLSNYECLRHRRGRVHLVGVGGRTAPCRGQRGGFLQSKRGGSLRGQIGRGAGRGRGENSGGAGSLKK